MSDNTAGATWADLVVDNKRLWFDIRGWIFTVCTMTAAAATPMLAVIYGPAVGYIGILVTLALARYETIYDFKRGFLSFKK